MDENTASSGAFPPVEQTAAEILAEADRAVLREEVDDRLVERGATALAQLQRGETGTDEAKAQFTSALSRLISG